MVASDALPRPLVDLAHVAGETSASNSSARPLASSICDERNLRTRCARQPDSQDEVVQLASEKGW